MKINQPVSQTEKPYPKGRYLVSKTDLKGIITYANDVFVELSGFSREELVGKNHNIVRHPDMPPQAFEDLWRTVKEGLPWQGIVKNRAKNGDHYWVKAFVVPVRENDRTVGYMSVRSEPARSDIQAAEALYRQLNQTKAGLDTRPPLMRRVSIRTKMLAAIAVTAVLLLGGAGIGISGISSTNDDLGAAYHEHLRPSLAVAKIVERLGDNRSHALLALQHNPTNPFSRMHDHPVDLHLDAMVKNRDAIEALRADYEKREKSPEEAALAQAFFAARDTLGREGNTPVREAIKAGDYDKANVILLNKINPLYKDVMEKGEALEQYLAKSGDDAYAASQDRYLTIRNVGIAGTLVALGVMLAAALYLLQSIITPLQKVISHFDHISQGNLTDDIDISGRDEAGKVLTELAAMQVNLKVMLDEINGASRDIEDCSRRIDDETTQVVLQSQQQQSRVQSVAAATEEFSQSVKEVADSANGTAQAAVNAQSQVVVSHESMNQSIVATGRVVEAVQASSTTITELNNAIVKIGNITQVIKEIADQTNLLALNAAIEAARAGEQGRGFAVVADEVRKLAERTSSSTADITATVAEIRAATDQAVSSMDNAVREVEAGTTKIRESGEGLGRITAASDEVTHRAQHIAGAAREQAVVSDQVAGDIEQVSQLIERNVEMVEGAKRTAEDLLGTALNLQRVVARFKIIK